MRDIGLSRFCMHDYAFAAVEDFFSDTLITFRKVDIWPVFNRLTPQLSSQPSLYQMVGAFPDHKG